MSVSAKTISKGLIESIKAEPAKADELIDACVAFLAENNLTSLAPIVLAHLQRFAEEERAFETLRIRAANELSKELEHAIKQSLGADDKTPVEYHTDESLVGGVVAEYRGKIIDSSIETILNRLTHSLTA